MRVIFHQDGIPTQFEGYESLAELDWQAYRKKYGNIQRLDHILQAEHDSPNRYKASKQADVLMIFYLLTAEEFDEILNLLGYSFDDERRRKIVRYYLSIVATRA